MPTCKLSHGTRPVSDNTTCNNVYLCNQGSSEHVELDQLCDGKENCGEEASVCLASRKTSLLFVSPTYFRGTHFILHCIPGLVSIAKLQDVPCIEDTFKGPDYPVFGEINPPKLRLPTKTVNCENVYGEAYVYLACMGRCMKSICPLKSLDYESCSENSIPNKAYSLGTNGYLTIVTKEKGQYHNRYFKCSNKKCVTYKKVCNLANDCGDDSDEANCTHFQCNTSKFYIPHTKKCDGEVDCKDYSDECNQDCGKRLISSTFLRIMAWVIGGTSVCMNINSLLKAINDPWNNRNTVRINRTLKMLISFGDLLSGLYLLIIVLVDTYNFKSNYCENQLDWLTSDFCALLGMTNIIGSHVSLFTMTFLSVVRLVTVRSQGIIELAKHLKFKIGTVVCFIIAFSVCIACTPFVSQFEDFYVNGMSYKDISLFIGAANKENHLDIFNAYYGKVSKQQMSWKDIKKLLQLIFSDDYGEISSRKIHFYGNEGVCLFKYFVKSDDPQKFFVWTVLTINFLCFLVISICYCMLARGAKQTNKFVRRMMARVNVNAKHKKSDKLQRNITRIIATDFVCWVPFIFICGLHSLEIMDATFLYSVCSIVILPINSLVNPLIYDDILSKWFRQLKRLLCSNSAANNVNLKKIVVPDIEMRAIK